MTRKEILQFNYKNGGNNYILMGNQKWVAFQKSIVDELIAKYNSNFNLIIYWYASEDKNSDVDYICVPYSKICNLLTPTHLSLTTSGNLRWMFIIKDGYLMAHANSLYSVKIDPYLNTAIR